MFALSYIVFITFIVFTRFRCLLTTMQLKPKRVESAVLACCCLHNILRLRRPAASMQAADVEDTDSHEIIEGAWRTNVALTPMGGLGYSGGSHGPKNVRAYLMDYYSSTVGAVHWQDKAIN